MRSWGALALVVAAASQAAAGPTLTFQSTPHPGIHRETWTDSAIPARIRLLQIDLTSSELQVFATKEADKGLTTSAYAARMASQVAINGDSFDVSGYAPLGLAAGASVPWTNTGDDAISAVFHFRREGERTVGAIIPPEQVVTFGDLPPGTEGVISGRPLLVRAGSVATMFDCNDPVTLACQRAPRTALALSADGNTLWLVVVDGWQSASLGLTAAELAAFLQQRGADMAVALDGGSSSTMVLDGSVISSPSDGVERTVANHLAVKYGQLAKGELRGIICKQTINNCATDAALQIAGAAVYLDDGRMVTTDAAGNYDFTNITPRYACVTVHKTGYLTATQCKQVPSGQLIYNSIPLFPGKDPPDAGVGKDSGIVLPDASGSSSETGGDAGVAPPGHPGGCCDAGGDHPEFPVVFSVVFGAWFLRRRRGTTAWGT